MKRLRLLFLLSLVSVAASSAAAERTLESQDFAALREVDEPNLSPDGSALVYVVMPADMEKDKLPGNLWLAKWDGSENRALTFGEIGKSHPAEAPTANGSPP